jgi:hypothetical protein
MALFWILITEERSHRWNALALGWDTVTGSFSVKDFNIYMTNDTEDDLIVENKYVVNSSSCPQAPYTYITAL